MREQITELMEQYHIGQNLGIILIGIGIAMIMIFVISTVLDIHTLKKKEDKYFTNFQGEYFITHNIKDTMQKIRTLYRDKEKEAKALDAGLYYIDNSLLRDYKGALAFIEHLFNSIRINELHDKCIKDAQAQKQLLLTKLEEEDEEECQK